MKESHLACWACSWQTIYSGPARIDLQADQAGEAPLEVAVLCGAIPLPQTACPHSWLSVPNCSGQPVETLDSRD